MTTGVCTQEAMDAARAFSLRSEKTCEALGLVPTTTRFPSVCGFSTIAVEGQASNNTCLASEYTKEAAEHVCTQSGARLCSIDELVFNVPANGDTGSRCVKKSDMIWSRDRCPSGRYVAIAAHARGNSESALKCVTDVESDAGASASTQCCADVEAPSTTSSTTTTTTTATVTTATSTTTIPIPPCERLGIVPFPAEPYTCMFQDVVDGDICVLESYADASARCQAQGARLCTAAEVGNPNIATGNTCGSTAPMWTTDTCAETGFPSLVILDPKNPVCTDPSVAALAQCCGDVPTTTTSTATTVTSITTTTKPYFSRCNSGAQNPAFPKVCGFSPKDVNGDCVVSGSKEETFLSHSDAEAVCRASDGRLCSFKEHEASIATATGCSMNTDMLWSSDPCSAGHIIAPGINSGDQSYLTPRCIPSGEKMPFRCCQDGVSEWPGTTNGATQPAGPATTPKPVTNPPTEKPREYIEKTSNSDICLSGFDEYVLTTKMQCDEAVASLADGATVSLVPASSSDSSWPQGCFHRGDDVYFFNEGGTTDTPTRNSFRICGVGDVYFPVATTGASTPAPVTVPPVVETEPPASSPTPSSVATDGPPAQVTAAPANVDPSKEVSKYSCSDLRAAKANSVALPSVCGVSKIGPSKTCYNTGQKSFAEAESVCSAAGLRMCSLDEVHKDVLTNSGCNSGKRRYVWTGTSCEGGHMVAPITSKWEKKKPSMCGSHDGDFDKVSIRCCADMNAASPSSPSTAAPAKTEPSADPSTGSSVGDGDGGGGAGAGNGAGSAPTCSCTSISSPVCGADGTSYANPCLAFCAGSYSFYPGGCSAMREGYADTADSGGYCPSSDIGMFSLKLAARLKNTRLRTLWDNRKSDDKAISKRKYTAEECAYMCVHFNTDERGIYGMSCHSFEHHPKQGRCELKAADASEVPTTASKRWSLYVRTGYCDSDAQGRDTATFSHGASKRPYK